MQRSLAWGPCQAFPSGRGRLGLRCCKEPSFDVRLLGMLWTLPKGICLRETKDHGEPQGQGSFRTRPRWHRTLLPLNLLFGCHDSARPKFPQSIAGRGLCLHDLLPRHSHPSGSRKAEMTAVETETWLPTPWARLPCREGPFPVGPFLAGPFQGGPCLGLGPCPSEVDLLPECPWDQDHRRFPVVAQSWKTEAVPGAICFHHPRMSQQKTSRTVTTEACSNLRMPHA